MHFQVQQRKENRKGLWSQGFLISKQAREKEALAVHVLHEVWARDTVTSSTTVSLFPPLHWGLEPWSNAHVLQEVICWATVYQNHKKIFNITLWISSDFTTVICHSCFQGSLKQTAIQCHHMKDEEPHSFHPSGSSSRSRDEGLGLEQNTLTSNFSLKSTYWWEVRRLNTWLNVSSRGYSIFDLQV